MHVPILQPFVHFIFFIELINCDKKIQENQKKYTDFATKLNSNEKSVEEKAKQAIEYGITNHKNLVNKNILLATFLDLKLLEAFLEAGPQFAFQISVILQDGISSQTQIFTIVTSALSLTWASSELYLKYPTEVSIYDIIDKYEIKCETFPLQEYMTKECGLLEQFVISVILLPNILGRALCLGVIFAITKIYGAIVLIILFASQLILASLESLVNKSKITSRMFLGILTSFTSPCLIVIEQSKHFLVNGSSGTLLYILAAWSIYSIVSTFGNLFPNTPLTLECHRNITTNVTMRCPFNANSTKDCLRGFFNTSDKVDKPFFTICPEHQWYFLWVTNWIITALMILSLGSIVALHYLINVDNRIRLFDKVEIDTCPKHDISIKPFIIDFMGGTKSFDEVNIKAIQDFGKPILQLMVQSKRLHITKVCT